MVPVNYIVAIYRYLNSDGPSIAIGSQGCQHGSSGSPDVAAQSERVHPVQTDDTQPHQRGQGGGEDGGGLEEEGQEDSYNHEQVAGGEVGVRLTLTDLERVQQSRVRLNCDEVDKLRIGEYIDS